MLPVLLSIGSIKIYTFGIFLVLAFFWSSFLLWRMVRLTAHKEEVIFDGVFIALTVGLFLARLFYVIANFSQFGFSFLKFILINGYPGLSIYGALIGFIFSLYFYCSYKKINFLQIVDYFIAPIFLALAIGFLGKFFAFENAMISIFQSLLFFLFCYVAYRILFLIRQEKFFYGFNLIFFVNIFSFVMLLSEKGVNQKVPLFLFLTTAIFLLYYFRIGLFSAFKNLLKGVKNHVSKIFKKGFIRNRGSSNKKEGGDRKKD
jgi:prolipoprotein diacylglyceryltransferase